MAEVAQSVREIKDFQGLTLDTDPHDLQNGSTTLQVNCTSEDQGVLRSRNGYALCVFEGELPFVKPVNYQPLPPVEEDVGGDVGGGDGGDDPIENPPWLPFDPWCAPILWEEPGDDYRVYPFVDIPITSVYPPIYRPTVCPYWG